jgi:signal transduction histidine kinase
MNSSHKLNTLWDKAKSRIEIADRAFVCLRIIIFIGGIGWLFFSDISLETFQSVRSIFIYFLIYSLVIYSWLFISPEKKKTIYGIALLFDLVYTSVLVRATGGFDSSFFNGFYLMTALYSFYFGLVPGTVIAAVASVLYFISCGCEFGSLHWADFFVRIAFLFLLAVPLGMLSQKLKSDKDKIENLNKELEGYIEELQGMQEKLIQGEKLSALGRLTADVAHEIRNPLTSIGGFARRLNKKLTAGTKEKEYAEIVMSEVDRLERILRDVLMFSREARFEMENQQINDTIRDLIETFRGLCDEQSIKIATDLGGSLPDILIDRDHVQQAVNNLISNAIDVMPEGGRLSIKTSTEEIHHADYVVVEVKDTGPGLTADAMKMLFEPFYTTKEIGVGTGLGLSICKKIMDEHNGLIFVDSKLGDGTIFKMCFLYQIEENGSKIKCWQFHKCGVEKAEGAINMRCPAYPDYGRMCWVVAGTFCGKKVSGAVAQKLGDCRKCGFYKRVAVMKDI